MGEGEAEADWMVAEEDAEEEVVLEVRVTLETTGITVTICVGWFPGRVVAIVTVREAVVKETTGSEEFDWAKARAKREKIKWRRIGEGLGHDSKEKRVCLGYSQPHEEHGDRHRV